MSKSLPTVAINRGGHLAIINESDYDPLTDTLWSQTDADEQPEGLQRGDEPEAESEAQGQAEEAQVIPAIEARLAELQGKSADWRAIAAIAKGHGITRPADGWDAAVLPILVAEYGQAAVDEVV